MGYFQKIFISGFPDGYMEETPFKGERDFLAIHNNALESRVMFGFVIDFHTMFSHLDRRKNGEFVVGKIQRLMGLQDD